MDRASRLIDESRLVKNTLPALVESHKMVYPCANEMNGSSQTHS